MARVPGAAAPAVYRVADAFVDRVLRRNGGLFVASRRVWVPDVIGDLHRRFPAADGIRGVPFEQRWRDALTGASSDTVQLAAELITVHVVFAGDLTPTTKRRLVDATLACATATATVPGWIDEALEAGLAGTGVAFKTRRLSQLRLLLDSVRDWKQASAAERRHRLADPKAFRDWLDTVPHEGAHAQREALIHLVHPDAYEPIVSPRIKQEIVAALGDLVPAGEDDVDRALASIRRALEPQHGTGFQFIDLPVAAPAVRWRSSGRHSPDAPASG